MVRPDFVIIPTQVLADRRLRPLDRIVFGYIYWLTKLKDGRCIASNQTLAELANASTSGVKSALTRLEQCGYATRVMRLQNSRAELVCNLSFANTGGQLSSKPYSNEYGTVLKRVQQPYSNEAHNKSNKNKSNKKDNTVAVPAQAARMAAKSQLDSHVKDIFALYLREFDANPTQFKLSNARRAKLLARIRDAGPEMVVAAIRNTAASAFHRGDNDRGWRANLDFIVRSYEQVERLAQLSEQRDGKPFNLSDVDWSTIK